MSELTFEAIAFGAQAMLARICYYFFYRCGRFEGTSYEDLEMSDVEKPQSHSYVRRMFKESLQRYFAPLTGAFRGVKAELIRTKRRRRQRQ